MNTNLKKNAKRYLLATTLLATLTACGGLTSKNAGKEEVQSVGISDKAPTKDNIKPVITLKGSSSLTITVGDSYKEEGATATDNVDGDITSKIVKSGSVDTTTAGTYTITYTAIDKAGNRSSTARVVVVKKKKGETPITISEADSVIYYDSAEFTDISKDLQDYLNKSSGQTIPIVNTKPLDKKIISLIKLPETYKIRKDGFIVSSPSENEIQLKAKNIFSMDFAVTDLLEKNIGIKWLFPSEEDIGTYIPHHNIITLKREERREEPNFINRKFSVGSIGNKPSYKEWIKKMRVVGADIAFHHNLYNLFPPSKYRESNPEFYPIRKGIRYPLLTDIKDGDNKRTNHSWQPVLTANGIKETAVENINMFFNQNPSKGSYSLGMNDTSNWGDMQLENKTKNSIGYYDLTDYYINWANMVSSEVLKIHPNKLFGFLAYSTLADAPAQKMNASLIPFLTYDAMFWLDEEKEQLSQNRIIEWEEKATNIGIYDYIYGEQKMEVLSGAPFYYVPRMYLPTMQKYYQFANEHNAIHYYAEVYPAKDWTEGPKLYITAKLLWDPYIDINEELNLWYNASVGQDAAPYLAKYYQFWEDFWQNKVPNHPWFFKESFGNYLNFWKKDYLRLLTPKDLAYLEDNMENMVANASSGDFKSRAEFFYKGWILVKNRAFGDEYMLRNDTIPNGYHRIYLENFEKNDDMPEGWVSWDRPNTGAIVHEKHITTEDAFNGNKSFKMAVTPDGENLSSTNIYKVFNDITEKKYCLRLKIKNNSNIAQSVTAQYKDNNNKWKHAASIGSDSHSNIFHTEGMCFSIPEDENSSSIRFFLSITDVKENKKYEVFFDDVELFEYRPHQF